MAPVAGTLITFVRRKPVILNRPTSRSTYRSSLEFPLFLLNHRASSDYDATASTGERERERGWEEKQGWYAEAQRPRILRNNLYQFRWEI